MSYTPVCFCPRSSVEVTVVDGVIVDVVTDEAGAFGTGAEGLTVDDLFTLIADAVRANAASVIVEYHPETGRPLSIYVDESERMADEEYGVTVTDFVAMTSPVDLPPTPTPGARPDSELCRAFERLMDLDDTPKTAAEAQAVMGEMLEVAADVAALAPPALRERGRRVPPIPGGRRRWRRGE